MFPPAYPTLSSCIRRCGVSGADLRAWMREITSGLRARVFPSELPQVPGLELAVASHPRSETSNDDFYDVLVRPDHRLAIALANLSGVGTPKLAEMAGIRGMFRVLMYENRDPRETLQALNHVLCTAILPAASFVDMRILLVDAAAGSFEYAGAGSRPLLVMREDGVAQQLSHHGPVLGVLGEAAFEPATHGPVNPGDLIAIPSHGCEEVRNAEGEPFGEARLEAAIAESARRAGSPQAFVDGLLDVLRKFRGAIARTEDVTILAVSRVG